MATIESLETIIGQKEETINRLQELLKECREDHTKEIMELQKKAEAQNVDTKEKQVLLVIKILVQQVCNYYTQEVIKNNNELTIISS